MPLEVLLVPSEQEVLPRRDLSQTVCVVFDVLRATTTMLTALDNGASAVFAVGEIEDALTLKESLPNALLAGERDGVRISAAQAGGIEFDLGNSPREFVPDRVAGRPIIMTTTNGTRALRSCMAAREVWIGAFLNLQALADRIRQQQTDNLLLICSGTFEQPAFEDILAAGALCELVHARFPEEQIADSVRVAHRTYQTAVSDLAGTARASRNARRLLARAELAEDVAFCLARDTLTFVAGIHSDGSIRKM